MNLFQPSHDRLVPLVSSPAIRVGRLCVPSILCASLLGPVAGAQERPDTIAATLLRATHPWLAEGGGFADVQRAIRELRESDTSGVIHWSSPDGAVLPVAHRVLAFIRAADDASRLERTDATHLDSVARRFESDPATGTERALFALAMDIVVARRAFVHRQGRVDPSRVHPEWSLQPAALDLGGVRFALSGGSSVSEVFDALEPQTRSYRLLLGGRERVRREDTDTSARRLAMPARPMRAGERFADAQLLATLLVQLGELPPDFPVSRVGTVYSRPLAAAVARWQSRKLKKGRDAGTLTAKVVETLLDEHRRRGERIDMAIERWRWLPRTFSADPLVVNLPEYRLHTFGHFQGDSTDRLGMNVVIGRADSNATPVFAANMTQVVFSPQWHLPQSIMLKEILPAAQADAGYLSRHNYELTTGGGRVLPHSAANIARIGSGVMVRQRSGDDNSLGKVKFLLPNPYAIYLHDTPSRSLFARSRRDFSHGCVRLGDPMAMARYVLGSQPAWTDSKITEAMNAGIERFVRVPKPIPVLIVYQTAVADPDGRFRFFDDIYGHDRTLATALEKAR